MLTDTLAPAVTAIIKRFVKARVPETAPLKAPWFDETACSAEDGYLIPEQMRENGALRSRACARGAVPACCRVPLPQLLARMFDALPHCRHP